MTHSGRHQRRRPRPLWKVRTARAIVRALVTDGSGGNLSCPCIGTTSSPPGAGSMRWLRGNRPGLRQPASKKCRSREPLCGCRLWLRFRALNQGNSTPPIGRSPSRGRVAGGTPFAETNADWLDWCRKTFASPPRSNRSLYDRTSGELRLAFFEGDRLLAALFLLRGRSPWRAAGRYRSSGASAPQPRQALCRSPAGRRAPIRPIRARPSARASRRSQPRSLRPSATVAIASKRWAKRLSAGTNCGSCRGRDQGDHKCCLTPRC